MELTDLGDGNWKIHYEFTRPKGWWITLKAFGLANRDAAPAQAFFYCAHLGLAPFNGLDI